MIKQLTSNTSYDVFDVSCFIILTMLHCLNAEKSVTKHSRNVGESRINIVCAGEFATARLAAVLINRKCKNLHFYVVSFNAAIFRNVIPTFNEDLLQYGATTERVTVRN